MLLQTCKTDFKRENKTNDIVKRLCVIAPKEVQLEEYPIKNPLAVFNPGMICENDKITLYARIIIGYYTYTSAVVEISFPFEKLYERSKQKEYCGKIVLFPDNTFDFWGVEDPRVYKIEGKKLITYCGRTINYFHSTIEQTLPVTAIFEKNKWKKICVFKVSKNLREFVISDKNAFLIKTNNHFKLFHRLHLCNEKFYLVSSKFSENILELKEFKEIVVNNTSILLQPANFEEKIGWGTPPVKIGKEFVVLLHGVDRKTKCYRVFAALLNEKGEIIAVTPYYIMEPKEKYEKYGDRPFTVFPCGAQLIDDKLVISYGAADSFVGIGEIEVSELMSLFDSNNS